VRAILLDMKRAPLLAAAAVIAALPAAALPFESLTVHSGLLMIVNGVENGAPNALVPPVGAWVPVRLPSPPGLTWEAGIMMMGLIYDYQDGRGVPEEVEHANTFWVLGLACDLRAVYLRPVHERLSLGVTGGLALLFRIPVIPYDEAASDWGDLAGFFLTRSIFPEVGGVLRFAIVDDVALAVQLRALYPLSNLWDADKPSWLDHLTAGVIAGLEFKL
jgi:hypothetical protein